LQICFNETKQAISLSIQKILDDFVSVFSFDGYGLLWDEKKRYHSYSEMYLSTFDLSGEVRTIPSRLEDY